MTKASAVVPLSPSPSPARGEGGHARASRNLVPGGKTSGS